MMAAPALLTFATMMRWAARLLTLYFVAITAAPALLFIDFQAHRSYIERELCVQREVMEGMRTCHGDCVLSKRFKALEHEAEQGFPAERLVRYEPLIEVTEVGPAMVLPVIDLVWSEPCPRLADGFGGGVDPVPKA